MINKKFLKQFINNQEVLPKIDMALAISEQRSRNILAKNSWYKDLYIDPNVDIVNSHPQVTQQVREELFDFLTLLLNNNVKRMVQIGLGHWASTHFILSLLLDHITTVEYDSEFIERYRPEMDEDFESIIQGDSTVVHTDLEGEFDAVFIDGNHSYEYVKKDLENFLPKVKQGGIVALHDVNFEGERYGSPQVLRESGYNWNFISYSAEVGIAYIIKGEE
jgi:predicted O-methyltransferase YrrM|tara:strand:- start:7978 stop:8637 length:660 start_codon:yes stop_codon:yes gene_type:complete